MDVSLVWRYYRFSAQQNLGGHMTHSTLGVIERLEEMPKQGTSYDEKGRHGWRNPIRSDTGPFLSAFAALPGIKRILEIGTAHGLSACYLGSQGAEIVTIEWDEATATEAQANLNEAGISATVLCGDAMKLLPTLNGQFDLVFLDANKDGYMEQFLALLNENLLHTGTLILADNVIDREKECANFLQYMKGQSVIIPTECGLLVGRI